MLNEKRVTIAVRCDYNKRAFYIATFEHNDDNSLTLVEEDMLTNDKMKALSYNEFMRQFEVFAATAQTRH